METTFQSDTEHKASLEALRQDSAGILGWGLIAPLPCGGTFLSLKLRSRVFHRALGGSSRNGEPQLAWRAASPSHVWLEITHSRGRPVRLLFDISRKTERDRLEFALLSHAVHIWAATHPGVLLIWTQGADVAARLLLSRVEVYSGGFWPKTL